MICRNRFSSISFILLLGFCVSISPVFSFSNFSSAKKEKRIAKDSLAEDIEYILSLLEDAHADPYRIIDSEDYFQLVNNLKAQVKTAKDSSLTLLNCYFVLQEMVAAIQDEHTYINFPFDSLEESELFLPFIVKFIDGSLYNIANIGIDGIPVHAEILEINGMPVPYIYDQCKKFLYPPLKHAKVSLFEKMIYFYLVCLFEKHSPWKIKFKDGNSFKLISVSGITGEKLQQKFSLSQVYKEYSIDVQGKDIPVLDIPNFFYGQFRDYKRFLDQFFAKHSEKEYLVIDLRGNPGGNGTWGYYMLDFLADSPYRIMDLFEFKVSDTFRHSSYRNKAEKSLKGAAKGAYIPSDAKRIRNSGKEKQKFKGRSFLLTSHTTNSAGVVTAAIFQNSRMGFVIGQETAGRLKFCSDPVIKELPHTGFKFSIPVAIYALPGKNPDRGVIPDIIINYTLDDFINERDLELERIRKLITIDKQ